MGRKQRKPRTPEEQIEDKKIILASFKEGLPMRRMEAKFDLAKSYINRMKQALLDEGLITEEEIKLASQEYYKEHPNAQGLDKSKVRKPNGTEKAERRHNKSLEDREKVFELVKQKIIKAQIAKKLGMSQTGVDWHIKKLIEER